MRLPVGEEAIRARPSLTVMRIHYTDGPSEQAVSTATAFEDVRVVDTTPMPADLDAALRSCPTDLVALVDTAARLPQDWLSDAVALLTSDPDCAAVAGLCADSTGTVHTGTPTLTVLGTVIDPAAGKDAKRCGCRAGDEVLFASRRTAVLDRRAYMNVGGLANDLDTLADVDLGWRLWQHGHSVRLAPGIVTIPPPAPTTPTAVDRLRLLWRNVEESHLGLILAGALLDLAAAGREIDWAQAWLTHLDRTQEERKRVQAGRRRGDTDIPPLMRSPFSLPPDEENAARFATIVRNLELDVARPSPGVSKVVVIAYDRIGPRMAGPSIRSLEFARAIAEVAAVTLISPYPIEREIPGVETYTYTNDADLAAAVEDAGVVVLQGHVLDKHPLLADIPGLLVVDLYDPWLFENVEIFKDVPLVHTAPRIRNDTQVLVDLLTAGDYFLCASGRQRDYWTGMMAAIGRVDRETLADDDTLSQVVAIVPFGCPDEPPPAHPRVLKGVHPSIGEDDLVILWSGGTWDWFDPLLVIEAFDRVRKEVPRAKLYFMGLQLEGTNVPEMETTRQVRERITDLGLVADGAIAYGGWVPYDERAAILQEADVAVVATKGISEVRLAFRTRVLDHFWCGLPTVTTQGDVLAEIIDESGAGLVVPCGDVDAMASALVSILTDDDLRARASGTARGLADTYRWSKVTEPLRRLVASPWTRARAKKASSRSRRNAG